MGMSFASGTLAQRANGAVTVRCGETVVFVSAVMAREVSPDQDFFPLTVDYREKFSAAGRFPGGYIKREGKPGEKEILTSRLCDRPLRPLFPSDFLNEVQIIGLLLSTDQKNEPDVLMVNGASAALLCSDIPWNGPIGCVRIGQINGEFIVNPTNDQQFESDLDLIYVGNRNDALMIEGCADQLPEERFIEALRFAQNAIQPILDAQEELARNFNRQKRSYVPHAATAELSKWCEANFAEKLRSAWFNPCRQTADEAVWSVNECFERGVRSAHGKIVPYGGFGTWRAFGRTRHGGNSSVGLRRRRIAEDGARFGDIRTRTNAGTRQCHPGSRQ